MLDFDGVSFRVTRISCAVIKFNERIVCNNKQAILTKHLLKEFDVLWDCDIVEHIVSKASEVERMLLDGLASVDA